jgi:methylated-DNA-[protein]-cysteine S-methyltransferase
VAWDDRDRRRVYRGHPTVLPVENSSNAAISGCRHPLLCYKYDMFVGRGYTVFDTTVGRCGIAWSHAGIVGVHLPEAREIETRRRMLRQYPEARELRPPPEVEIAINGIVALLRGRPADFNDITLDMQDVAPFNRRVYAFVRTITRGETMTFGEVAKQLGASGASHAVAQAIGRNPFTILVPCHRVLAAVGETNDVCANGGIITKRRLLSLEGALTSSGPTLFDVLLSVAPPRNAG